MKRNIIVALVLFSCSFCLSAGDGGSIYTRYGIGDLRYFQSGRSSGLAGVSIAVLSNYSINRLNPASWTNLSRTRYELGGMYEGILTADASSSAYFAKVTFEGFMISFPILPSRGIILSGGLLPLSRTKYEVGTLNNIESLQFENRYIGEGGLSIGHIGSSVLIGSDIHLGAKVNYYFGTLTFTTKQVFSGSAYTNAEVKRSTFLKGIGYSFGGIYTGLGDFFNIPKPSSLSIGLIFSTATDLKSTEEKYYTYSNPVVRSYDTLITETDDLKFPFALGGGIAFTTDRMLIASDFYFQKWSGTPMPGNPGMRNVIRAALGMEILTKRDPSTSPLKRIAYRCGIYYNSTYYKIKNHSIDELGITAGIGFPVLGETRLDMGLDFSFRGTKDDFLQKDNIIRFIISLAGGEPWFVRPVQD